VHGWILLARASPVYVMIRVDSFFHYKCYIHSLHIDTCMCCYGCIINIMGVRSFKLGWGRLLISDRAIAFGGQQEYFRRRSLLVGNNSFNSNHTDHNLDLSSLWGSR